MIPLRINFQQQTEDGYGRAFFFPFKKLQLETNQLMGMIEWGFNDTATKIPIDDSMGTSNENNINKIDSKNDLRRIWRTTE